MTLDLYESSRTAKPFPTGKDLIKQRIKVQAKQHQNFFSMLYLALGGFVIGDSCTLHRELCLAL